MSDVVKKFSLYCFKFCAPGRSWSLSFDVYPECRVVFESFGGDPVIEEVERAARSLSLPEWLIIKLIEDNGGRVIR